jgi:signal transduction histidine kinase
LDSRLKRLFLKIFLWFWFSIAVLAAALFAATAATSSEPFRLIFAEIANVYASGARLAYRYEGAAGVQNYLDRIAIANNSGVAVFDAKNGVRIAASGEVSERAVELAVKASISKQTEAVNAPRQHLVALPLDDSDLILVADFPPPRGFVTPSWQTRLLRILAVIFAAGLVCYALARYLTAPLKKLQLAAREFASGNLQVRVAPQIGRWKRDEVAQLAGDFDEMARRIENLIAAQKRLTSDVSHELRSPLARLNVALELARAKAGGAEIEPLLARIERESGRLNALIEQILTVSRLETGASGELEKFDINLVVLLNEIVADADFEAKIQNKAVRFFGDASCVLRGNENLLRSAFENVIRNAVRHTAENTSVDVSLRTGGENTVVTVRDRGAGVPAEDLEKIFQPFFRVEAARDRTTGGIGLGLAIAERAVLAHGGRISAANANDGGNGLAVEISFDCSLR